MRTSPGRTPTCSAMRSPTSDRCAYLGAYDPLNDVISAWPQRPPGGIVDHGLHQGLHRQRDAPVLRGPDRRRRHDRGPVGPNKIQHRPTRLRLRGQRCRLPALPRARRSRRAAWSTGCTSAASPWRARTTNSTPTSWASRPTRSARSSTRRPRTRPTGQPTHGHRDRHPDRRHHQHGQADRPTPPTTVPWPTARSTTPTRSTVIESSVGGDLTTADAADHHGQRPRRRPVGVPGGRGHGLPGGQPRADADVRPHRPGRRPARRPDLRGGRHVRVHDDHRHLRPARTAVPSRRPT